MLNAIDVPFDASKYAFRTNFDGLTITNNSFSDRLENAKTKYQDALTQFESVDKDARKEYKDSKDEGFTSDNFGTWVVQNYPQWSNEKSILEARGTELTQIAMAAFGPAYQEKHRKDQSAFNNAAYQAGHHPEIV
ncbi:hypothetical protein DTO207G8_391 [Paecilomyces variotii]|nr:hypothetical protein DTO032I3_4892 [Paecilomyces variotii]KAJ9245891.1 hypothetical protein DTO169E5_15 [Paecilomyces variotii]KAJ9260346.1 hypothetical protein DTO207G8_391 [Paecilomyces variotii]KAJ9277094.1 hypothetical protein DTO021D3_5991 [Paecilomyces variotii]KAJ9346364.1 hypothetical protein DTO027B6_1217 [Paecilomyces variotii]